MKIKGGWVIKPVEAKELPHHLPLNGIYQGGILIATVGNYNHCGSTEITNLITAAPELLAACKDMLDIILAYQHIPAQKKACIILQEIIKKAEDIA